MMIARRRAGAGPPSVVGAGRRPQTADRDLFGQWQAVVTFDRIGWHGQARRHTFEDEARLSALCGALTTAQERPRRSWRRPMIACGCQEVAWLLPSADTGPLHHPRYPPGCEIDGPKHAVASPEVVGGVLSSRDIAVPCVGGAFHPGGRPLSSNATECAKGMANGRVLLAATPFREAACSRASLALEARDGLRVASIDHSKATDKVADHATSRKPRRKAVELNAPQPSAEPILVHIGRQVLAARQRLGLTQEQLAEKAGCAATTVFLVENARRNATIRSLSILAGALGVDIVDLFPRSQAASSKRRGNSLAMAMADEFSRAREALSRIERLAQAV